MNYLDIISRKYDRMLLITIGLLIVVGTVMLYSASSELSMLESGDQTDMVYLWAHAKRLLVGLLVMVFFTLLDYRHLKPLAAWILGGALVLLLLTKLIFVFKGISAPARWMYLGSISIQTSDIARLALIIFLAAYIDKKRETLKDLYNGFLPPVFALTLVLGLIIIQPDFSTAVVIGFIAVVLLFIGGAQISQLVAAGSVGLTVAIPVMLMMPYRRERILTWLSGESAQSASEAGYQITQSMISLGNGGFWGLGLGNSLEKNLFLPTPHTDFIFAIIGEELGFIGAIVILTLFLIVFQRGIRIAKDCTDPFGVLLAIGIALSFVTYAFVNAAVVTHMFPVTGLPMPMISYGGSEMVIGFASLGILLNISQSKRSVAHQSDWRPTLYG